MKRMVLSISSCRLMSSSCMSRRMRGSSAEKASSMSRMSGSMASARARPTRCCMPPESWLGHGILPALQADELEGFHGLLAALLLGHALDFKSVFSILAHGAVGEEGEILEHHAELFLAEFAQGVHAQGAHVHAVHDDLAFGGFDEAVDAAPQGGLAAAGKAHDDDDFAFLHGEAGVVHAGRPGRFVQDFLLAGPFLEQGEGLRRVAPKI